MGRRITSGISQTGGKWRLVNRLKALTPYHEFFLSLFLGAAHFELNKPRCRYECWNDAESDIINYLVQIHQHPKEFDAMKQGVFGLVSQEICNRIVNGKIKPKNDVEKAYLFYYLNKLTFGGSIWKVRKKPPYRGMTVDNLSDKEVEEIKTKGYRGITLPTTQIKTKGYTGLNQNRAIPQSTFHEKDVEEIKAKFRGVPPAGFQKKVDDAKANFRGVVPKANYSGMGNSTLMNGFRKRNIKKAKEEFKERQAPYGGLIDCGNAGGSGYGKMPRNRDLHIYKNAAYKGTNPKITRPYTNNDCGLLSPINPEAIKRLRYVNLTAYDFRKVYKMFYEAFYVRKGLERECFIFEDPPYPGTEKYYGDLFPKELHQDLIENNLKSPFNIMQTIGGDCKFYIDAYEDAGWNIVPVKVRYSTDANSQKESQEYICMNYEIENVAKMIMDSNQKLMENYI